MEAEIEGFSMMYFFLSVVIVIGFTPTPAHAYLDPGTGNAIGYFLLSGAAALIYFLKSAYYRIFNKQATGTSTRTLSARRGLILFCENRSYWSTFQTVAEALIAQEQPFSYFSMDMEDPGLTIDNQFMESRYIGTGTMAYWHLGRLNARILLATTPNIGSPGEPLARPPGVDTMVHLFHSVADISMYRKGSLDHYDVVLLAGTFQAPSIRAIERKRNLPAKRLAVAGLPYLDALDRALSDPRPRGDKPKILIGSSWGSKGCLRHYGHKFIGRLLDAGYHVVIRPHPNSLIVERPFLEQIGSALSHQPNLSWDLDPSPETAMASSDILVSDTSSIRLDYAFLYGKPVITLEIPEDSIGGLELDDLDDNWIHALDEKIGVLIKEDEISTLDERIRETLAGFRPESLAHIRDELLPNFGQSGEVITRWLVNEINQPISRNREHPREMLDGGLTLGAKA